MHRSDIVLHVFAVFQLRLLLLTNNHFNSPGQAVVRLHVCACVFMSL